MIDTVSAQGALYAASQGLQVAQVNLQEAGSRVLDSTVGILNGDAVVHHARGTHFATGADGDTVTLSADSSAATADSSSVAQSFMDIESAGYDYTGNFATISAAQVSFRALLDVFA